MVVNAGTTLMASQFLQGRLSAQELCRDIVSSWCRKSFRGVTQEKVRRLAVELDGAEEETSRLLVLHSLAMVFVDSLSGVKSEETLASFLKTIIERLQNENNEVGFDGHRIAPLSMTWHECLDSLPFLAVSARIERRCLDMEDQLWLAFSDRSSVELIKGFMNPYLRSSLGLTDQERRTIVASSLGDKVRKGMIAFIDGWKPPVFPVSDYFELPVLDSTDRLSWSFCTAAGAGPMGDSGEVYEDYDLVARKVYQED